MINYGAAFAIGYLGMFGICVLTGLKVSPWSPRLLVWGGVAMGLNWVATLG